MPSYRRRGILSSLMRRQIDDIHERGEPIAVLWASDARIYGRFGYGRASWHASFTVRHGEGVLSSQAPADPGLRLRITEPPAALAELAKVYDTLLPAQPGFFVRSESWWNRIVEDPDEGGPGPRRCAACSPKTTPAPAATRCTPAGAGGTRTRSSPTAVLDIRELVAIDPAATAALWSDLLSRDLVSEVTARLRPVDDPLLHLLADPRRARPQVSDGLWVRIIDVPAALTARRYAAPVNMVIEVTDEMCPWNAGRWRVRGSGPVLAGAGTTPGGGHRGVRADLGGSGRHPARGHAGSDLPRRHVARRAGPGRPGHGGARRRAPAPCPPPCPGTLPPGAPRSSDPAGHRRALRRLDSPPGGKR